MAALRRGIRSALDSGDEGSGFRRGADIVNVCVVVPTFNDGDVIGDCLSSVLAQRGSVRVDVLVVDDGSSDGTADSVSRRFPAVEVIRKEHRGSDHSRQVGVEHGLGDVLAFIDADCVASPDWLAVMTRRLAEPETPVIGGRVLHRGGFCRRLTGIADFGEFQELRRKDVTNIPTCNLGVRREVFDRLGFDVRMAANGDTLFAQGLRRLGVRLAYDPDLVVEHQPATGPSDLLLRARRYGASFVEARRLEPGLPYAGLVRAGVPGVVTATMGRAALDCWRLLRFRHQAGFRLVELPAAVGFLVLRRVCSLPASLRALHTPFD